VVGAGIAIWRAHAVGGRSRALWVALALLLAFWFLAAINSGPLRPATSARYVYVGGVMTLLVAAELLGPVRPSRLALTIGAFVVVASVAVNLVDMRNGYRSFKDLSDLERGALAGLEIARDTVDPNFRLGPDNAGGADYFNLVDARSYLSAVDAFGSPAYSEEELLRAAERTRAVADEAAAAAERLALAPASAPATSCEPIPFSDGARTLQLGPGTVTLRAGAEAPIDVRARRFAQASYPADLGRIGAGESEILALPTDRARTPWTLEFEGPGAVSVCRD
jgi:hypothetical protein